MDAIRAGASLPVTDASQVGEARREGAALAARVGLGEAEAGRVAIVVTELARNLLAHATDGELILQASRAPTGAFVEVLALDRGPGIGDVRACLRDGYSTAGTPGTGLGAVERLAALFDVHSVPGIGTALVARVGPGRQAGPARSERPEVGAVCLAKPGQTVSGDGFAARHRPGRTRLLVVDGLGHGPDAAEASRAALVAFDRRVDDSPASVLEALHRELRATRGAAAAVADLDQRARVVRFAGVGNVAGVIHGASGDKHMVSHNGTLGHEARRFHEFSYPWPEDAIVILHSDGLATRWSLDRYPGLASRHPALVAGVLYRDFARGRDDVTVVAAREWLARPM